MSCGDESNQRYAVHAAARLRLRRLAIVVPLIASALTLASCTPDPRATPSASASLPSEAASGGTPASETKELLNFDGFVEEYSEGAEELSEYLPEGWTLPEDLPGDWEPDGQYEAGVGYMTAAFVVQCGWMKEYARGEASADEAMKLDALQQLREWITISGVVEHTDQEYADDWVRRVIEPAEKGDATFLRDLAAGC